MKHLLGFIYCNFDSIIDLWWIAIVPVPNYPMIMTASRVKIIIRHTIEAKQSIRMQRDCLGTVFTLQLNNMLLKSINELFISFSQTSSRPQGKCECFTNTINNSVERGACAWMKWLREKHEFTPKHFEQLPSDPSQSEFWENYKVKNGNNREQIPM